MTNSKKTQKRVFSLFTGIVIAITIVLPSLNAFAAVSSNGHYKYTVNEDGKTVTITEFKNKEATSVTTPTKLGGRKVTAIDDGAFISKTNLKTIKNLSSINQPF